MKKTFLGLVLMALMTPLLALATAPTAQAARPECSNLTSHGKSFTAKLTKKVGSITRTRKVATRVDYTYRQCVTPNMAPYVDILGFTFSYTLKRGPAPCDGSSGTYFSRVDWEVFLGDPAEGDGDRVKSNIGRCQVDGNYQRLVSVNYPRYYVCSTGDGPVMAIDTKVIGHRKWEGNSKSVFFPVPMGAWPIHGPYRHKC